MNVTDITAETVAKAVGGTLDRDGSVLCRCPIHEASGTHNPSLILSITETQNEFCFTADRETVTPRISAPFAIISSNAACRDRMLVAVARTMKFATTISIPTAAMPGRKPDTSRKPERNDSAARYSTAPPASGQAADPRECRCSSISDLLISDGVSGVV